jgi:hypothetical protein
MTQVLEEDQGRRPTGPNLTTGPEPAHVGSKPSVPADAVSPTKAACSTAEILEEEHRNQNQGTDLHSNDGNVTTACKEHLDCPARTSASIEKPAKSIYEFLISFSCASMLLKCRPSLFSTWMEGFCIVAEYAKGSEFKECIYCTLSDIILGPAALPIMTAFLLIGKKGQYTEVVNGLRKLGEDEWIIEARKKAAEELADYMAKRLAEEEGLQK